MTKQCWTTDKQQVYLESLIPNFINTQLSKNTLSVFYPATHKEWRKKWPTPTPTSKEVKMWGELAPEKKEKAIEKVRNQTVICIWIANLLAASVQLVS